MLDVLRRLDQLGAAGLDDVIQDEADWCALDAAVDDGLVRIHGALHGGCYLLTRRGQRLLVAAQRALAAA